MARTFIRQEIQIGQSDNYIDNVAPGPAMESGAANIENDLNNIRSILNLHKRADQSANWHDDLVAPTTFLGEGNVGRGIDEVNQSLHNVERKRVLRTVASLVDVTVGTGDNFKVLLIGELPGNTTAAVGAVTTRGTVAAAHGGTFGTHALTEVTGTTSISPKNLCEVVDGSTRDPILSGGRTIYALFQTETATDGHTMTGTTTTRAQLSFVRLNATGDDLEAVPASDIQDRVINYASIERVALEDLNEQDFLRGAMIDAPAGFSVDRQGAYNGQGSTPVDVTTNSVLDLEGAGLAWRIRDDAEANLLSIIEGSAGGTSEIAIGTDVDVFNVDAVLNDFRAGVRANTAGTRPVHVGATDGVVETTSGDLRVLGAAELFLDDGNQTGSTWAQTSGIKLSETTAEWDAFEARFGEVSLLNALTNGAATRTKVQSTLTADVAADSDVNGPGTPHANVSVDLAPYDNVNFVDDVEVYLNGELLRNAPNDAGGEDVYPGGDAGVGDLRFQFNLNGTSTKPDQLTVIVNGQ